MSFLSVFEAKEVSVQRRLSPRTNLGTAKARIPWPASPSLSSTPKTSSYPLRSTTLHSFRFGPPATPKASDSPATSATSAAARLRRRLAHAMQLVVAVHDLRRPRRLTAKPKAWDKVSKSGQMIDGPTICVSISNDLYKPMKYRLKDVLPESLGI